MKAKKCADGGMAGGKKMGGMMGKKKMGKEKMPPWMDGKKKKK